MIYKAFLKAEKFITLWYKDICRKHVTVYGNVIWDKARKTVQTFLSSGIWMFRKGNFPYYLKTRDYSTSIGHLAI